MMFLLFQLDTDSENNDKQVKKVRKRTAYSLQEKLDAVRRVANGEKRSKVLHDLNLPESVLRDWIKNKDRFKYFMKNYDKTEMKGRKRTRLPDHIELDRKVYEWYMNQPDKEALTVPQISRKGTEINKSLKGDPYFFCTRGWVHHWKIRYGLKYRSTHSSQEENNSDIQEHVLTSSGENESVDVTEDSVDDTVMNVSTPVLKENESPVKTMKTERGSRYSSEAVWSRHLTQDINTGFHLI